MTDDLEITTLTNTTSLHDDWLHRGAFLADLDLHTYIAHVVRIPRPTQARIADVQRFENVFLFDDHYELAKPHWQQLQTHGFHALPMLEALRCQPPDFNNGEDKHPQARAAAATHFCTDQRSLHHRSLAEAIADSSGRHDEQRLRSWQQELRRSAMPPSVFPSSRTRCCSALTRLIPGRLRPP